jgi:activating signal cointegrator complex subunit 3
VYDAKKGAFTELGMLDVQQIFGRAGRPQFDTSGEATIITAHSKLAHYLGEGREEGTMHCYGLE